MLTANRHHGVLPSCLDDVVNEARKWRNAANEEGSNRTPIASKLGRVAVDSMEVVHVWYRNVSLSDDEVATV